MKLRELIEQPHAEHDAGERDMLQALLGAMPLRKALHQVVQMRRDMAEQALNVTTIEELLKLRGRADGLMLALDVIYECAAKSSEETDDDTA